MNKLITIIGPSGIGKTALVRALAKTSRFETAFEQHAERPFQALAKQDARFTLANQMDYLLLRAEQEKQLRDSPKTGLMDGGSIWTSTDSPASFSAETCSARMNLTSADASTTSPANCSLRPNSLST